MAEHLMIDGSQDLATRRRLADELVNLATEPSGVSASEGVVEGVPVLWLAPTGAAPGATIVHAHGGHSMCSVRSHRRFAGHLAAHTGRRVCLVGYRRTPENHWTAALDDVADVVAALASTGPLALSGESAGGGIALAIALGLVGERWSPDALLLLSPWLDRTLSGDSMTTNAQSDLFVKREGLSVLAQEIFGDEPLDASPASPLFGQLRSLPRTLVQVASDEVLLDDSRRFVRRAVTDGVDVTLQVEEGMQHAWHLAAGTLPAADRALMAIGTFLASTH